MRAAWITGWDLRVSRQFVERCGGKVYRLWRPCKGSRRTKGVVIAWEPDGGDDLMYIGRVEGKHGASAEYYILHRADGRAVVLCRYYSAGKYKLRVGGAAPLLLPAGKNTRGGGDRRWNAGSTYLIR